MNDLNTQQIILLCLLVSFVTSIATGITTVSLLDQAPEPVTQTINRVVERTVERVVEAPKEEGDRPVERIVETVVVNQEDLTVEAVAKNESNLVRIYALDRFDNRIFTGLGLVIAASGRVVADAATTQAIFGSEFEIDYAEGTFRAQKVGEPQNGIVFLDPQNIDTADGATTTPALPSFAFAGFGDSQNLKLAQSIIVLSGENSNTVASGIVTGLQTASGAVSEKEVTAETVPIEVLTQIDTSVAGASILPGSILITLKGDIVGFKTGQVVGESSFVPANSVKGLVGQ